MADWSEPVVVHRIADVAGCPAWSRITLTVPGPPACRLRARGPLRVSVAPGTDETPIAPGHERAPAQPPRQPEGRDDVRLHGRAGLSEEAGAAARPFYRQY